MKTNVELSRGAVQLARRGLRCASASLTTSAQQSISNDIAVDFTFSSKRLQQCIDEMYTEQKDLSLPNAVPALLSLRDPLRMLRSKLPSLNTFFSYLLAVVDAVESYRTHSELQLSKTRTEFRSMNDVVRREVDAASVRCGEEVRTMMQSVATREHELSTTQALNTALSQRLKEVEEINHSLRDQLNTLQRKQDLYERTSAAHRTQAADFQNKANLMVHENQYLRNICRHNRDLLQEIEDLKEGHHTVIDKYKETTQTALQARDALENEAENAIGALQQLSGVVNGSTEWRSVSVLMLLLVTVQRYGCPMQGTLKCHQRLLKRVWQHCLSTMECQASHNMSWTVRWPQA